MTCTLITILGTIGPQQSRENRATYRLSAELATHFTLPREQYTNTLPLLLEFARQMNADLIPLSTESARKIQQDVLAAEGMEPSLLDGAVIIREDDFEATFAAINDELAKANEVILDVSHGFRHLPILATVSMIIHNITDSGKIRHILFAKEIERQRHYEVIDLRKYLDIANMAYILQTFQQNYTVVKNVTVNDKDFCNLLEDLSEFSSHILANSLKFLMRGDDPFIQKIRDKLNRLRNEQGASFSSLLDTTIGHFKELASIAGKPDHERLYGLSREMCKRGYLLNAITLLYEALAAYAYDVIRQNSHEKLLKKARDKAYKTGKLYKFFNASLGIFLFDQKEHNGFGSDFAEVQSRLSDFYEVKSEIVSQHLADFQKLARSIKKIRNNLAHGNTGESIKDVAGEVERQLTSFNDLCLQCNILQVKKEE
ncbi:CRISPR-associated DxTHG motif protein [Desulfurispirillum indicum]|uniref:CRISPR-associated DxTHG motif protein n=1 Tax=Desulfurispirillum indicum TaxID=936456 RepID=UPI001CFB2466|nr:TM1812 family CRISPR-associated protein [Desulfurispirillum indicum]UCZ57707.1 CRISPR-associated DxTHG motif protein [Desulfurispirillum indicum]